MADWLWLCNYFFLIFISLYSLYRGRGRNLLWQFWTALHCTLVWLSLHLSTATLSPSHLKQLQGVHHSISSIYMKPINSIPSSSSPPFILPFPQVSPLHCTYFTVLSFIISSKVKAQMGFSMYLSCEYALLWSVQSFLLLSLVPSLPTSIIQQLSVHIFISSTCIDVIYFGTVDSLSFSFLFPLPQSSIE
jgi:hypothetical protein